MERPSAWRRSCSTRRCGSTACAPPSGASSSASPSTTSGQLLSHVPSPDPSPNPTPNHNPYSNPNPAPNPDPNYCRPFLAHNPALEVSLLYTTKLFLLQRYSTMPSSIFSAFNAEELKVAALLSYAPLTPPYTPAHHLNTTTPPHTTSRRLIPSHTLTLTPPCICSQVAASVATFRPLAMGQTLYAVGDEPSDFWVVAHGEVMCDYCDGSAPTTLQVGSYFGEVRSSSTHQVTSSSPRVASSIT